jgi:hypothetical protein
MKSSFSLFLFSLISFQGKEISYKESFDSAAKKSFAADAIIPHLLRL